MSHVCVLSHFLELISSPVDHGQMFENLCLSLSNVIKTLRSDSAHGAPYPTWGSAEPHFRNVLFL